MSHASTLLCLTGRRLSSKSRRGTQQGITHEQVMRPVAAEAAICGRDWLRQHHARAAVVVLQSGWRLFGHVSRSGGRQRPSLASSGSEWGRGVLKTGQGPLEAVSEACRVAVLKSETCLANCTCTEPLDPLKGACFCNSNSVTCQQNLPQPF